VTPRVMASPQKEVVDLRGDPMKNLWIRFLLDPRQQRSPGRFPYNVHANMFSNSAMPGQRKSGPFSGGACE
jgi:hypothetical protein